VIAVDERSASGGLSSTPFRISTPDGWPSRKLKRSPFTPATVAPPDARFSIEVTVSRPTIRSFERTGLSP